MILNAVRMARRTVARLRHPGRLFIPANAVVGPNFNMARQATLRASAHTSIGADCTVMAHVELGSDVMISSRVAFIGDDHPFQGLPEPISNYDPRPLARIVVEGDNLIGFGAILIGPLTVGHGAIVAAGAVVTGDVEPETVYAGIPAKQIAPRRRGPNVQMGPT